MNELFAREKIEAVVAEVLEAECLEMEPFTYGADPKSRVVRLNVSKEGQSRSVICKLFNDGSAFNKEAKSLKFMDELVDFTPKVFGCCEASLAIVMEYIAGDTLYDLPGDSDFEEIARAAIRVLAKLHCAGFMCVSKFKKLHEGSVPKASAPDLESLRKAWQVAVGGAAGLSKVPISEDELKLLTVELERLEKAEVTTLILFDVNPFNFIWTGREVKIVDLGTLRLGPAFADLDIVRRMTFPEEKILELQGDYAKYRQSLGAAILEEEEFIKAVDYWSAADALCAAASFQRLAEGNDAVKESLPEGLRRFASYRDDVLADLWTVTSRRPELSGIAVKMEKLLLPEICQERRLRSKK